MKKAIHLLPSLFIAFSLSAQPGKSLVKQDTSVFRSDECRWLIRSSQRETKPVPQYILESIRSGKLKAIDPQTGKLIPGNKILTWKQSTDTVMIVDEKTQENHYKILQPEINPTSLSRIRVYQDWYFYPSSGKLQSQVTKIELLMELHSMTGEIRGFVPFCRINY